MSSFCYNTTFNLASRSVPLLVFATIGTTSYVLIAYPFLKFKTPFYISDTNNIISLPLLSTIRYYVFSHDVIHSSGIYSSGIKIDATPGRLNFTSTIRTLIKGEHRGFRYEPRGLGHSPTLTIGPVLLIMPIIFIIRRNESIGSVGKKSHAIFDVVKNRNHFLVVKN